jgi:hypothetical protein
VSGTENPKRTSRAKPKAATGNVSAAVEENSTVDAAQAKQEVLANQQSEAELKAKAKSEADAAAEAEAKAEAKAKEEAKAAAEAEAKFQAALNSLEKEGNEIEQVDTTQIAGSDAQLNDRVLSVLGAFKVRAKSADGFWRSGVQFHRIQEKLVFVVDEEPDAASRIHAKGYEPEHVVFLAVEDAKRVHREPNLAIEEVELADVIDLSDTE